MPSDPLHPTALSAALLEWYGHMGVDEALDENTTDWYMWAATAKIQPLSSGTQQNHRSVTPFSVQDKPAPSGTQRGSKLSISDSAKSFQTPPPPFAQLSPDGAVMAAGEQASSAQTLEKLEKLIRAFDGCALKTTAKNTCVSRGNPNSDMMLIGEAPGRDEDLQGLPFVGRAGQLLDKMLAAIGRDESSVYITNTVYWRPPGNRTPTPQEAQICRPFLDRQIELINPKFIIFLGGVSAKHMLDTTDGIMKLRGKWKTLRVADKDYKALATLHPAYLLRNPADKRKAWQDFLMIKHAIENSA